MIMAKHRDRVISKLIDGCTHQGTLAGLDTTFLTHIFTTPAGEELKILTDAHGNIFRATSPVGDISTVFKDPLETVNEIRGTSIPEGFQASSTHTHVQPTTAENTAAPEQQPTIVTSEEGNTMANANTAANNNANTNGAAEQQQDYATFLQAFITMGLTTPEQREEAWTTFLGTNAATNAAFQAYSAEPFMKNQNKDQAIYNFLAQPANEQTTVLYLTWLKTEYQPSAQSYVEARSRFTLTGESDQGIRSSWIAAGAAVIGGGMETFASGSLTVGSGVGTLAGAIGAFFLGELVDDNIESTFGRYTLAGTIGLGLGAIGSRVGRNVMAGRSGNATLVLGNAPSEAIGAPAGLAFLNGL